MRRKPVAVGVVTLLFALAVGIVTQLLNGPDGSTSVSAAEACNLMDTPYDTLATLSAAGERWRTEIRDSGPDRHILITITADDNSLIGKVEEIIKDRTMYHRESVPGSPEVYGEWRVHGTNVPTSISIPCLASTSFVRSSSDSSDEPHFTFEQFLSEEEGAMRNEFWADSTGRPTRARKTFFPPEYDGVSNTQTGFAEFTYSNYGEPNLIEAPCAGAAPDDAGNPALMRDCVELLGLKDTLRGTAVLNWSVGTAIASWDGVTVAGTPSRVTKLLLSSESLTGSIPSSLERLQELTHLNLNGNSLTGEIPAVLGRLENLEELRLSGNSLTGCIPLPLKDVTTNDLSSLNLLYCHPPKPENLTVGTVGETSVSLSWDAVTNASKYRVEYVPGRGGVVIIDDDAIMGTSHTVDRLTCESEYEFHVSAYFSGSEYAEAWSDAAWITGTTAECMSPVFEESEYTFEVAEDASDGDAVGTVSATHPDDDTIEFSIKSGNTGNAFAISTSSGAITVAGTLDYETTPSYTLTVQAEDDDADTDTAEVTITVTNVAEDPPSAPEGLNAVLDAGVFTLTWNELVGSAKYEAQHKTNNPNSEWTALPETTALTQTYTPAGGEKCGTTYQFRVRAYGDGVTYTEEWGTEFGEYSVETDACNVAPVFDPTSYTLEVREDAEVDDEVGTVSATDEDTGDTLTYTIESGNTGSVFAIGSNTGTITVAGALDYETAPSYTLTVKADDGNDGTATTTVTVTVTDVAEDLPPAPTGVSASLTNGTFTISWDRMNGADNYEAQYRTGGATGTWTSAGTSATTTLDFSPTGGPDCSTTYDFRVRARGDGVTYVADWGPESMDDSVTTGNCDPEFNQSSYTFEVAEDADVSADVGTVTATDEDTGDTLTYSIESGNAGSVFAIGSGTGAITVAGPLDYETTSSYTLTVKVTDSHATMEGTDTATVTVNVTDVAEDPPPAPTGLTVSLTDGTFAISWTALNGAAKYEAQHKTDAADSEWTALPETTGVGATYTPVGSPDCGTEYQFRVRVYGDGDTYTETWGVESGVESVETATCVPEFGPTSYTFNVAEDAEVDDPVGTVSATDEDTDDTLTYSIISGNEDGGFDIDGESGEITVSGELSHAASPFTITVEVDDGNGGTDTATVTVTASSICENGTVISDPGNNADLVADCKILYAARSTLDGTATLDWDGATALTNWQGVRVSVTHQRVWYLLLADEGLNGSIPATLGDLSQLRRIDLDGNSLTGEIPEELGNLSELNLLYLFDNSLTGEIPEELGNLSKLQVLYLEGNQLSGNIPAELGNLNNLRQLVLGDNSLSGSIPATLGDLGNLRHLLLRDNNLNGRMPRSLTRLNLEHLSLSDNSFHGCIPSGLLETPNNDFHSAEFQWMVSCAPTFYVNSYSFSVAENTSIGDAVGTIYAEANDLTALTYSITAGNEDEKFAMNGSTGEITVAGTLDHDEASSYSLKVEARDAHMDATEIPVTVSVTEASS